MDEPSLDVEHIDHDEITDSINRMEKKVSKINVKLHLMKMILQDVREHQSEGMLSKLWKVTRISESTRLAIIVASLCGVVSASIVWLFIRIF